MRAAWMCILALLTPAAASAQVTVTAPAVTTTVASANDFPTQAFQDPIDMNQRTDVGWWLNSVDQPLPGWSSTTFSGGIFTGVASNHPNLWVLETGILNVTPTGKNGHLYPIDADRYRIFAVRMRVPQPGYALFLWSTNTIYEAPGLQTAGIVPGSNETQIPTTPGWRIYTVDLATLALITGTEPWAGTKRSLRFDPAPANIPAGSVIDVDWIRLVENRAELKRTVTWTGSGAMDIYLDSDNTPTSDPNQTLGLVASGVSGGSYVLNVGALAPGRYYVAMRPSGSTGAFAYSAGSYIVNEPPTIQVTAPSEEGSANDFATVHLANPWDMADAADVDMTINVTGASFGFVPSPVSEAGTPLGQVPAFFGTSTTGTFSPNPCGSYAKPAVYPMHWSQRGANRRIDPARYRILTADLGLPNKARDLCGGSIVRIVWLVAGETVENYSRDIPLNSRAGANVVNRLNLDMKTLPVDPGSPAQSGWVAGSSLSPGIAGFRIDPHEFPSPTPFYVGRVKLAALETANTSFTVRWTTSRPGGSVNVYYDTDKNPSSKVFIGSTAAAAASGSLSWNTAGLGEGEYYVYVEQDDGWNVNGAYGKWPVRVTHTPEPTARLVLNRSQLNFGVVGQTTKTPAQTVRLTALDAPAGQPCWTTSSELWFVEVSPASGCGSATLIVRLTERAYPPDWNGEYIGTLRIASAQAINSPQGLQTTVRIQGSSAAPQGTVDTPRNGEVVEGSLPMTGWAVDDIGIARVTICRDAVAGEAAPGTPLCGAGQIYLGDAVSVDDARSDVASANPAAPFNYRAGWGYLILTNMLPGQGTGSYVLHARAYDVDGHATLLGSRQIVGQNGTALAPFGAIDTPAQGETISGGNYPNFGWVLSRVTRADPPGGGQVYVYVDGVNVGAPGQWTNRADLTSLFAGFPGVQNALGVFGLNTYAFGNGLHTIAWLVIDNHGRASGIGSRYFSIFNTDAASTVASVSPLRPAGPDLGRHLAELRAAPADGALRGSIVSRRAVTSLTARTTSFVPIPRLDLGDASRVVVEVQSWTGKHDASASDEAVDAYSLEGGVLRELPVGAAFDARRQALYWSPGPAFRGIYDVVFVRRGVRGYDILPVRFSVGTGWPAWAPSRNPVCVPDNLYVCR